MLVSRLLSSLSIFIATTSFALEPITPLNPVKGLSATEIKLGRDLFKDVRLSKDNSISCESCHNLAVNGTDNLPKALGVSGQTGLVKTPTVYNSAFSIAQFWDGRSRTLEEQVSGPIHNPVEMATNWADVLFKLRQDRKLVAKFKSIFPDGLTASNIAQAIATFERSLVTVNSPFDRWLNGDDNALTYGEKEGYRLFKAYGCVSCHQGKNVGGNMYAYMGTMRDYFSERARPVTEADLGRFNVTGNEEDKHLFKVPSLRLAGLQKYYFHDANSSNLEEAIQIMARYQLGREINELDAHKIGLFLNSLVGEHEELAPR